MLVRLSELFHHIGEICVIHQCIEFRVAFTEHLQQKLVTAESGSLHKLLEELPVV